MEDKMLWFYGSHSSVSNEEKRERKDEARVLTPLGVSGLISMLF